MTIIARAIGIPMVGRIEAAMDGVNQGDMVALDGDNGHVYVRPNDDTLTAFQNAVRTRAERKRFFDEIRELPSVTRDGIPSPCRSTRLS